MKRRKKFIFTGAVLVVLLGAALFGAFGFSSVCSHCGSVRQATRWQIPFTDLTLWETHTDSRNDFSDFAARHGRSADGPHQWVFAAGGGNGITCAIGRGRYLWPTIHHCDTQRLLEICYQVDEQLAGRVLDASLDPARAGAVFQLALGMPEHISVPSDFRLWMQEHTDEFTAAITHPNKAEQNAGGNGS